MESSSTLKQEEFLYGDFARKWGKNHRQVVELLIPELNKHVIEEELIGFQFLGEVETSAKFVIFERKYLKFIEISNRGEFNIFKKNIEKLNKSFFIDYLSDEDSYSEIKFFDDSDKEIFHFDNGEVSIGKKDVLTNIYRVMFNL